MSSPPPTKPPRGVKQGKETSGLLMSVIRTLSASETNEQREKERAKLEKEYKKSDARLDELVAAHAQEIMDVMQKFSLVGSALSTWGAHSDAAVARLAACRGLLRLRRDDLRRLWQDARTHHHALNMLTDIERVVVSEREAREALAAGRVLAAAHTLRNALRTACDALAHVSALHATRVHLEAKKHEVVSVIMRRLSGAVYRGERSPALRASLRGSARRRANAVLAELTKSEAVTDAYLQDITPEYEASLTEDDCTFETTAMISLEALGVLDQLKEATEKFKCEIQNELLEVIDSVSRRIIEDGDFDMEPDESDKDSAIVESETVTDNGRPLARLIACLSDEFKACASRNKRLVHLWRAALARHSLPEQGLHTELHYWSAVQQVLQLLLTEYLDIESVTLAARGAPAPAELRLADYFARKRPPRRTHKLFRLATPAPVSAALARRQRYPLVCRPEPALLHAVLPAIHRLAAHIEAITGCSECSLRVFITDYVRTGESERLAGQARAGIQAAARAPAAWRERTHPQPGNSQLGHRVIFTCVMEGWRAVEETARAARRAASCGGMYALRATTAAIAALATQCRAAQARLAPAGGRAARWLADDDIVRFLQALPNWAHALQPTKLPPEELKQAYEREAEILGSSLGDGAVTKKDIIADVNVLADLAVLCESMDWLSANIKSIPSMVGGPPGGIKLTDKFLNDIASAAMIFDEIAHKCLLLLHLEVRIECFHYLCQSGADAGEEGGAAQLARALLALHEATQAVLASHRMQYVVHGVGEMMSAAVVWRAGGVANSGAGAPTGVVSATGLRALSHCLGALQLPHAGLARAHNYLHLLECEPEEIIAQVREKGAQFSELEYLNAFKVIGARRGIPPGDMRAHLKLLSEALGHVGVTV